MKLSKDQKELVYAMSQWMKCYHKHNDATFLCYSLRVAMDNSLLLPRILEGKKIFDEPPPLAFGYPWYELIENGKANARNVVINEDRKFVIIDNFSWMLLDQYNSKALITYEYKAWGKVCYPETRWEVMADPTNEKFPWLVTKKE